MEKDYFHTASAIRFLFPIDGDHVNEGDGELREGHLLLPVTVRAAAGAEVTVNGIRAPGCQASDFRKTIVLPQE